jgi:hypothetical protein
MLFLLPLIMLFCVCFSGVSCPLYILESRSSSSCAIWCSQSSDEFKLMPEDDQEQRALFAEQRRYMNQAFFN